MGGVHDANQGSSHPDPALVALAMFFVVYMSPWWLGYGFYQSTFSLEALGWQYNIWNSGQLFWFRDAVQLIEYLPGQILLLLLPIQMWRLYSGETTIKRTAVAGLFGWIPWVSVSLLMAFSSLWMPSICWGINFVPIPTSLCIAMLVIWRYPPPHRGISWIEEE